MAYLGNTPTTQNFVSGTDYFNGTGSQTAFTLSRTVGSINDIQVTVNNVVQQPNDAYTLSGTTLTMTSAPSSGTNNVYVRYLSTTTQVITPSQNTVGTAQLGTITNIASGNSSLTLQTGSSPTTAVTISTAQKVGIGTTPSGSYILEVNGNPNFNSVGGVYLTCGTYDAIKNPSGSILAFGGVTASQWDTTALYTGGTERMRITSAGTVLLGTTSTSSFDSGFRANPTGSGNSMQVIISNTGGGLPFLLNRSDDGNIIDFRRAGTNVGAISVTTSSTAYNTSSDYRLKENIAPMTGALAKVTQLKPVTYTWKSTGETSQGFIAHELQAVVPDCVTGEKDAVDEEGNPVHQGVDTSYLVATLTAAIQELKAVVDAQAVRIAELEGAR